MYIVYPWIRIWSWRYEKGNVGFNVYEDCINHCITTKNPLPQWYLLMDEDEILGCARLITNDF